MTKKNYILHDPSCVKEETRVLMISAAVSYTHLTLPTTPYV